MDDSAKTLVDPVQRELRQPIPGVRWFDVADPNSPELDEAARRFGLHELQIEDCRHRGQRAKAEHFEDQIFCVLKLLHRGEGARFEDLDVFIGRDFLLTVHVGRSDFIEKVRRRVDASAAARLDRILYTVVDQLVDEYVPLLDHMSDEISEIESQVLSRPEQSVLRRIFRLKRKLVEFRRTSAAMREVVNSLARREDGMLGNDLDPYFRDVYDHLVRDVELVESSRDLLTGALDIYLSSVANRTNEVVKVLTIYGLVLLPFVVVTGFFGMNLDLPLQRNPYGAAIATVIMGGLALGLLVYFRKRGLL